MMQEKKNIDAMAEKYKEEMMRIYNKKRSAEESVSGNFSAEHSSEEDEKTLHAAETEKQCCDGNDSDNVSDPDAGSSKNKDKPPHDNDNEKLMHPPMPKIPDLPDARFESGDNNDGHMQGNYNFNHDPDAEYENEDDDSGDDARRMTSPPEGHGYLQVEVTESGSGSPVAGAAVIVVRKLGDSDTLEAILTTDSRGTTEAVALDAPVNSGDNGSGSYEDYMVTVCKEGFYSVNMLPVPIFDTIKSIQPVELIKI